MRPGLAMSQDGRNWARIEADHHSGALFDVGEDGAWDALFIGAPQARPWNQFCVQSSSNNVRLRLLPGRNYGFL